MAAALIACGPSGDAARPKLASTGASARASSNDHLDVTVREGTSMAAALSPDGRTIALDLQGSLWVVPISGGRAKRITDEFYDARQPTWSPDGKTIAFQSFRSGDWDIWSIDAAGGGTKPLTSGPFDDREPQFSHDGTRLLFSSDRSGSYDIWELTIATGHVKQLTNDPASEYAPVWSPDDREIAYASDRKASPGIYRMLATGGPETLASAAPKGLIGAPSWGPGGGQLLYSLYTGDSSDLFADGKPISSGEDVFPFRVQWISPTEILYTADGKIKRRALSGGVPQTIEFSAALSVGQGTHPRRRRDFDATAPRPVRGIVRPVVSPDGKEVAFAALGDLWISAVGGKPRRVTGDSFVDMDPAWSPDGSKLVFSSDRAGGMDLWIHDLRSGATTRLTELPSSEIAGSWSPDGRQIAFVAIDRPFTGALCTVDVETKAVRKVREAVFGPSEPTWSPDGKRLMVASLKPTSSRYREGLNQFVSTLLDGTGERSFVAQAHRGSDTRSGGGPTWSPDGKQIAFVLEGALAVMNVTPTGEPAGEARTITKEIAHSPSWTGDSRSLVYLSNDRLKMVSAEGGEPKDLGLDLTYTPKMPAARYVVHVGRLVDGRTPRARSNIDIVVEGSRIRAVEAHADALHTGAVVDAANLTAMPGLIDMHTHLIKEYGEAMGRIWLAYGVTTIRNTGATTPYSSLEDREAVEAGVRPGPRLFTAGYLMDGTRVFYPFALSISSERQLEGELQRSTKLDLDLLKTYVRLPDALQRRVVEYAHQSGLPVSSHEIYPAALMGVDGTEHTSGTSRRGYSPKVSLTQRAYEDVVMLMSRSGMAFTPTVSLVAWIGHLKRRDPTLLEDPRYKTLFPAWVTKPAPGGGGHAHQFILPSEQRGPRMAFDVMKAGGNVLAGTDSPFGPYGVSLHAELMLFVDGGMTPLEALQTATVAAAKALNAEADLGSVEAGKLADIVLVEGDPLTDIASARKVQKVIKNGEVFDVSALLQRPVK